MLRRASGVTQAVEHLPSKCEAPSSSTSGGEKTQKTNKQNKNAEKTTPTSKPKHMTELA
jgi:hypothetical protein